MNTHLEKELTDLLFRQAPLASLSLYPLLAIVLYLFWGQLPHDLLLLWAVVALVLSSAMLLLALRYRARPLHEPAEEWVKPYSYLLFFQDLSWGLIGPLSFLSEDPLYRTIALFMLAGMSAGAVATRAVFLRTYAVSLGTLLLPTAVTLALHGDEASHAMLALTVVFIALMLPVARNYGQNIRRSMLLWLDNEQLVASLTASKQETDDANRRLRAEVEQRKAIEGELVEAKERAERANEAKNQFLANISHELRTPLSGIIGFSTILDKAGLAGEPGAYITHIRNAGATLLRIVNDILDVASIESGHLKLVEHPFALHSEIDEVLAVGRTLADAKGLSLDVEIDTDVPNRVIGDAHRFKQVITNVLGNAIKYTNKGSVRLRVSVASLENGREAVTFQIADTGIGIPQAAQETIFEPFVRAEKFEKKRYEGAGLGLAIVNKLLPMMGGAITFQSTEGEGATFTFTLPLRMATDEEASIAPAGAGYDFSGDGPRGLRVLVVDDSTVSRAVLTAFLRRNGIGFEEAASGTDALRLLREQRFDVALIDIQMPDMTGIEVTKSLLAWDRPIPRLIAVTAHAFPEERREIMASGFAACLVKPLSEDELLDALAETIPCAALKAEA